MTPAPVHQPQLVTLVWAVGLLRFTWLPFLLSVFGQWLVSFFEVAAMASVAFAIVQLGGNADENARVLPDMVRGWLPDGEQAAIPALAWALVLLLISSGLDTGVALMATWIHVILNRRFTPTAFAASLATNSSGAQTLDAATAVQRWLLKLEVVEFLHTGLANTFGAIGAIVVTLVATFSTSGVAGWVCVACLMLWCVVCVPLTLQAITASRRAAQEHEAVGRLIRSSVALRADLSRPSLLGYWIKRSRPQVQRLESSILWQGVWGSLLFGTLGMIANGMPSLALLASIATSGLATGVSVFLYASRIGPPLGNLARILPMLQDQIVSLQRIHDLVAFNLPSADQGPSQLLPQKLELQALRVLPAPEQEALAFPNIAVSSGNILCVLGPSGSGKSTLLSAVAGQRNIVTGAVMVDGRPIDPRAPAWRETCLLMPQEPELIPGTIRDNLHEFPGWHIDEPLSCALDVIVAATNNGIDSAVGTDEHGVSTGQRRAIALLRALGTDARVLLLDEPIAGVDDQLVAALRPVLEQMLNEGRLVILGLHRHDFERLGIARTTIIDITPT